MPSILSTLLLLTVILKRLTVKDVLFDDLEPYILRKRGRYIHEIQSGGIVERVSRTLRTELVQCAVRS